MPGLKKSKARALVALLVLLPMLGFAWFLGLFNRGTTKLGKSLEPFAEFSHPKMEEVSGLVAGSEGLGVLWAHNDSGNEPRLFALRADGEVVTPPGSPEPFPGIVVKGATLRDWEAIARNGEELLICELGNNLNASQKLGLYVVEEPNPETATEVSARFLPVSYPDQTGFPPTDRWHFDSEAAFCWGSKLYILTKNRPAFRLFIQEDSSHLYRLDLSNEDAGELVKVDSVEELGGWVTGADISADGKWVVVLCESPQQCLWLFERPQSGERFFSEALSKRVFRFQKGGQLESVAFWEDELIMINEERQIFRISLDEFEEVAP